MDDDLDSDDIAPTTPAVSCPGSPMLLSAYFPGEASGTIRAELKGSASGGQKRTVSPAPQTSSDESSNSMNLVVSDSSEDPGDGVSRRALADVDTILQDLVPAQSVVASWDDGLSPEPLHSFQHGETKCRHWAWSENPDKFICSTEKGEKHHRGGNAHMDILKGICAKCLHKASVNPGVQFRQYVTNHVKNSHSAS